MCLGIEPIIRHNGNIAVPRERRANPGKVRLCSRSPTSAIEIHNHRARSACWAGRIDIEAMTIARRIGRVARDPEVVKRFGDLGPSIERAVKGYAEEVRSRAFPGPDHVYPMRKK